MALFRYFCLALYNDRKFKWDFCKWPLRSTIFSLTSQYIKDTNECPARQCRLAILCWMEGGNTQQGCGYNAWLYSCCMQSSQSTVKKRNPNYIHPTKLKQHEELQSSFSRRRYDTAENQLMPTCGIPRTPSNTLQKRIIGGRPAHFAEFPWQSHIRIKEYQCGGGNEDSLPCGSDFVTSINFSSGVKKVCRHSGSLCESSKTSWNCDFSRWTWYAKLWFNLWATACWKTLGSPKVCPPTLSLPINSAGSIRCCSFKAPQTSWVQVSLMF